MKMKTHKKRKPVKLRSIEQEKAACIAAFKRHPKAKFVWCCHHEALFEENAGWRKRIEYIAACKSRTEQASRFRSYRPVKDARTTASDFNPYVNPGHGRILTRALLNREWPSNTWNVLAVRADTLGGGTQEKQQAGRGN